MEEEGQQSDDSLYNRADNNIIPDSDVNLNPNVNKHEGSSLNSTLLAIRDLGAHKKGSSGELVNPDIKSNLTPSGTNIIMTDFGGTVKSKTI